MNFLLIQTDQQRRDSLGFYGNPVVRTPYLDGLAREGVVFDHAFTPVPICAPSRASLVTGLRPVHHGILRNPESGSYYDTLCSNSSQIEITGINITPPPGSLACFNVIQPGLPAQVFSDGFESGDTTGWSRTVP